MARTAFTASLDSSSTGPSSMPQPDQLRPRWRPGCCLLLAALCLDASAPAGAGQAAAAPPAPAPASQSGMPALPGIPRAPIILPAFSVVIDAAHGGTDSGARITPQSLEKDLNLSLSIRLRSALAARGIAVTTTRESDASLPADERAAVANHARASACLIFHSTASGSGVHLFTSSLQPAPATSLSIPWATAQAAWVNRSLRLSSEINSALGQAAIPVTLGSTSLRPLDHLTCPAVAIEIAPLAASSSSKASSVLDGNYQQRVLAALAAAILEWSTDWKQQP